MKVQWSLRTMVIVMTLGGPLGAEGVSLISIAVRQLSSYDEVDYCGHDVRTVTWTEAKREAQEVSAISERFQEEDRLRFGRGQSRLAENSLHRPASID